MSNMQMILETEFKHCRNREVHIEGALSRLREYLCYEMFNKCCSIQKQIQAKLPDETIIENFKKL